ncbi:MAG: hydrolase [Oscillospiraceae bacterium]|jgi:nicotinamidase-related amidase|nr:hydrolase [Oscillospiraceae bacterium]
MRAYPDILLDPAQSVLVVIDHQPQMYFGIQSHDRQTVRNNTVALCKAALAFDVPVILTTVEANGFSGFLIPEIQNLFPGVSPIDRTTINCWEDEKLRRAVRATGRSNLILAGLWTEACVCFPALCMKADGYNVLVAADACGGATAEAHERALQRMDQYGVEPVTWQQVMLEWQRDWANKDTYPKLMEIIKAHSGAYGLGVVYAESMVPQVSLSKQ